MIYAGMIPLALGAIFYFVIRKINPFTYISMCLYNSFVTSFTVWMYVNGILEIYGTTNELVNYYMYAFVLFLTLTIVSVVFNKKV